jgi:hypothetical protein
MQKEIRYESVEEPESCPRCRSKRIARFMYGKPSRSLQLQQKIKEGKIVLGGCCIGGDIPTWKCMDCKLDIYYHKEQNETATPID